MSRTNQEIGESGEKVARKFLISRGFWMREMNYTTPFGEIDMIAEKKGCTVFFEVKTRISEKFGSPLAAITREKQKHILKNCQYYLKRFGLVDTSWRIDAIAINLNNHKELMLLKHIRNAIVIKE